MRLVWLDLETTGLDPARGAILEVGIIITDERLEESARFQEVVRCDLQRESWDAEAWDMHLFCHSGLQREAVAAAFSKHEVEIIARHFLSKHIGTEKGVLAGSSVHFDRAWLAAKMPSLLSFVGHRHLDTSVFKVLGAMYGWPKEEAKPVHRALRDLEGSIALLRETAKTFQFGMFQAAGVSR